MTRRAFPQAQFSGTRSDHHDVDQDDRTKGPGPQVLNRTFAILGVFSHEAPEWTTTEVARARDLPVPTVHRILSSLQHHGFVTRDKETRRFRLGSGAIELGRLARAAMGLRSVSLPVLERLTAETGETSLLTALNRDRNRSVCLERVESRNELRLSIEPGRQNLLHAGASQKALLSFMGAEEIDRIIDTGLPHLCRATITDPANLRLCLEEIRSKGWATSYEETNLGVWGIALTLLDNKDTVVAAIGLAGPRVRMPRPKVTIVLEVLKNGASDIAETLGLRTSIQLAEESRQAPSIGKTPERLDGREVIG